MPMKFKPTLIPTLFTIPAVIVLLFLGSWQVQRLQWKNNLLATINEKLAIPMLDFPSKVENFSDVEYRKVRVKGEFLHDKEVYLFVGAKEFKGKLGYDILTPLKRADGSVVLVDRGWVPYENRLPETRPETLTKGEVEVEGMVHKGETQKRFTPANEVDKNLWFWIDIPAIEKYTGTDLQNMYIRALKKDESNMLPIAGDAVIRQRNDHLQYAITWYALAFILVVIYGIYHVKRRA
jgi:surfeit locus 1 family protein